MPAKINKSSKKIMEEATNEILEKATLWLWARATELAPRGGGNPYARPRKSSKHIGETSIKLNYEIDYTNKIGTVGVPPVATFIATINEYGTSARGAESFVSFNGEPMPKFTLPYISPKNAKVLCWCTHGERPTTPSGWKQANKDGRVIYTKRMYGMFANPFLRPSLAELRTVYIHKIIKDVCKNKFK